MSNPTPQRVCRLLGGSGRVQLAVAPTRRVPALCTAFVRSAADTVVLLPRLLPLAA